MSAQIGNHAFGNIGRMFARQNVPTVYARQRSAGDATGVETTESNMDSVSLSAFAPKPLDAVDFETAMEYSGYLSGGGKGMATAAAEERLREDRIFAAVSALAAMGVSGEGFELPNRWPGGIPVPTREELEVARRRLSQRLQNVDQTSDPEKVQLDRTALVEKLRKRDFGALALAETPESAVAAPAGKR